MLDASEKRLQGSEASLSPLKLPELVDSELAQAKIAKARLAWVRKAEMERSALFAGPQKSVLSAMPELHQELREKQKIIDKIDADSERHRRFTSELERWLFDLKQEEATQLSHSERMARAESANHAWHEQMTASREEFQKEMAKSAVQAEEIRSLSGEVPDEEDEEGQLDGKLAELKVLSFSHPASFLFCS